MFLVRRQISPHVSQLRREMTDVERILWDALRNRGLDGCKFRRQASIGPYVVDFLCPARKLIVELDGGQHDEAKDAARSAFLTGRGYRILRFWNHEVIENNEGVLTSISAALAE